MSAPTGYATWDDFNAHLRTEHRGHGDELGHWFCACGATGGGTGPNSRDWKRGHGMHLRNVTQRAITLNLKIRTNSEQETP